MAILLVSASVCAEDIVTTHKGQRYVGTITSDTADAVEITITIMGDLPIPIRIPRSDVKGVFRDQSEAGVAAKETESATDAETAATPAALPETIEPTKTSAPAKPAEPTKAPASVETPKPLSPTATATKEPLPTRTPTVPAPVLENTPTVPAPGDIPVKKITPEVAPTETQTPAPPPPTSTEVPKPRAASTSTPKAAASPPATSKEIVRTAFSTYSETSNLEAARVFRPLVSNKAAIERINDELLPLVPPPMPTGRCRAITADINIRLGPSTDYERVGSAAKGTVFTELEEEDGWYHGITSEGVEGWILGRYTDPLENQLMVVTGDRVNFRQSPDTKSATLRRLDRGDLLLLLRAAVPPQASAQPNRKPDKEDDYWVQARDVDGNVGWLSALYSAVVVSRPALVPRIYERSDLLPLGLFAVTPADAGDKWRSRAAVEVTEPSIVRNGRITVVVQYNGLVKSQKALLDLIGPADEKDLLWRRSCKASALLELGFDSKLTESIEGVIIAIFKGKRDGEKWVFDLTVGKDAALTTAEQPLELKYGIVVQEGENRGAIIPFEF